MKKSFLLVAALLVLLAMTAVSLTQSGSSIAPFLGVGMVYDATRLFIGLAITILLVTVRPRPMVVRVVLGAAAVDITAVAFTQALAYTLPIIDALVYIVVAIGLMVEALEDAPEQSLAQSQPHVAA